MTAEHAILQAIASAQDEPDIRRRSNGMAVPMHQAYVTADEAYAHLPAGSSIDRPAFDAELQRLACVPNVDDDGLLIGTVEPREACDRHPRMYRLRPWGLCRLDDLSRDAAASVSPA